MDVISGLFGTAASPFLLRSQMRAPFAIDIADHAALTFVAPARGEIDIMVGGGTHRLGPSGLALVRGTAAWRLGDTRASAPLAVIEPGQVCRSADGTELVAAWDRGVRTWGNASDRDASHVLLSGTYEHLPATAEMLLEQLPEVLVVDGPDAASSLRSAIGLLNDELLEDHAAQHVVLSRLADLTLALTLRHWVDGAVTLPPSLVRGYADDLIGAAIRALLGDPAEPWTIERLARVAGMSRAAFARRFADITGTTPIALLTRWRLALAAERLRMTDDPIVEIATDVGYGSAFALSTAFKRRYGLSPRRYRAGHDEGARADLPRSAP
ncbi:AraC family transcriptional regulator [Microbacterium album]|nr:AraC family transcriptional regulator [Microbacterium album]